MDLQREKGREVGEGRGRGKGRESKGRKKKGTGAKEGKEEAGAVLCGVGRHLPPRFTCCPQNRKLADHSNVISKVSKCSKIQIFWGSTPDPAGEHTAPPRTPSLWGGTRYPLPITPPLISAHRASFLRVSGSNPLHSWQPY